MNTVVIDDVPTEKEHPSVKRDRATNRLAHQYAFECSEYFHLAELSPVCSLIYGLAYKVTKGGQNTFFPSAESVGQYINRSPAQVRRGFQALETLGFFELKYSGRFRPNEYKVIGHTDWAKTHPKQCCVKLTYAFTADGDPLGITLWNITGGAVKFQRFQIESYRRLEPSEERIVTLFRDFWESKGRGLRINDVSPYFYKILESHSRGGQN